MDQCTTHTLPSIFQGSPALPSVYWHNPEAHQWLCTKNEGSIQRAASIKIIEQENFIFSIAGSQNSPLLSQQNHKNKSNIFLLVRQYQYHKISPKMQSKILLLLSLITIQISSIKLILYVSRQEGPQCLYHYLNLNQKYSLTAKAMNLQTYRIDLYRQQDNEWKEVYHKDVVNSMDSINKMAVTQSTHMFCFSNNEPQILKVGVQFMSGLELGQGHALPSLDDHNLLDNQISWMQKQKQRLIEIISRIDGSQASANLKSSSGKMLLFLAILGVASVVAINYFFFRIAKKTLKDRKLI